MRPLLLLPAGLALSLSVAGAQTSGRSVNLQHVERLCVVDTETNVEVDDDAWLPARYADQLLDLVRTRLTAYRMPVSPGPDCGATVNYLSVYILGTKPVGNARAYSYEVTVNEYTPALKGVVLWTDGGLQVTSKVADEVAASLTAKVGQALDRLAADWAISHP